jgi:hypothetical protein
MTTGKLVKPPRQAHKAGGTYGQGDISPAAQKSKIETTRAGEPTLTPSQAPSPAGSQPNGEPQQEGRGNAR